MRRLLLIKRELAFNTLTEGTYTLKETKAPANYKLDETEHAVVVTYDADKQIYHVTVDGKAVGSKAVPVEIANEADIKYIDLEASKVWDDQDNQEGLRPESVEFNSIRMAKLKENQSRFQPQQTGKLTLRIFR